MQFMIIRKADAETEAGMAPSPELLSAMMAYNEELVNAGVWRGGDGLKPSSQGARVQFRGGRPHVVDGPFAETKELIAGYTLIEVGSLAEAIEWVRKWPALDAHGEVALELRPLYTEADFAEAFTPESRAQMERIDAATAALGTRT